MRYISITILCALICSCSRPQPGPDKSVAGAVLGAAWGAGAGAVVGNQINNTGPGSAVGAGFGLVSGAMVGMGDDAIEETQVEHDRDLASLKIQNLATAREIANIQEQLDNASLNSTSTIYQVYFDDDATSLKAGSIVNLELIADGLKRDANSARIEVVGHSDDSGTPEHNLRVAEARARTVASYLTGRGLSSDRVNVKSFGSSRPVASNLSAEGRQLNRRVEIYFER